MGRRGGGSSKVEGGGGRAALAAGLIRGERTVLFTNNKREKEEPGER